MRLISTAGDTIVPAILSLEGMGFVLSADHVAGQELVRVTRGDETYVGDDPVGVLGLVKLG